MSKQKWLVLLMTTAWPIWADTNKAESAEGTTRLPGVTVYGAPEGEPFLPDVEGAKIYEGKKTTAVNLDELPPVNNNNFRQAFSQVPGLVVSEMTIPSHVNINYRGVGDPHESQDILTLQDGTPTDSDWFGYPTEYYAPPLEAVERVDFIRGGSALLYGPQPGPVINYVTYVPPRDQKFTALSQHTFGSWDLYSTYNQAAGTVDGVGYLAYYHHRQGNGPRKNADFEVNNGSFKLALAPSDESRLIFNIYAYGSESGEAGRLNLATWKISPNTTATPDNRIWIERYVPSVTFERDFSEETLVAVKAWGGYQDRFSRRQTGAANANLDRREFYFAGLDARLRHFWYTGENEHTFTGGAVTYFSWSPRERELGTPPTATTGTKVFDVDAETSYGALFAENAFHFGRFGIIPAFRLDFVSLRVKENFNTGVTRSLIDEEQFDVIPLGGLGLTFDVNEVNQVYANASVSYKPKSYDDLANPTSNTQQPPSDLDASMVYNYELGVRGTPRPWFFYDASVFYIDYDNIIETRTLGGGNTEKSNSGRAHFYGAEAAVEVDLFVLYETLADVRFTEKCGNLSVFGNTTLLEANFVDGNNEDNTPSYAPRYVVKTGGIYRLHDRAKISMTGQIFDEHYWQDSHGAGGVGTSKVDSYMVWDLAGEVDIVKDKVTLIAGLNNVFDEMYFSRVRSDGIEPAFGRNFYAGVRLVWPGE